MPDASSPYMTLGASESVVEYWVSAQLPLPKCKVVFYRSSNRFFCRPQTCQVQIVLKSAASSKRVSRRFLCLTHGLYA
jgi:hypothetical protein